MPNELLDVIVDVKWKWKKVIPMWDACCCTIHNMINIGQFRDVNLTCTCDAVSAAGWMLQVSWCPLSIYACDCYSNSSLHISSAHTLPIGVPAATSVVWCWRYETTSFHRQHLVRPYSMTSECSGCALCDNINGRWARCI